MKIETTKIACDRCGAKPTAKKDLNFAHLKVTNGTTFLPLDLCEACYMNFEEFMKEKA